MNSVALRNYAPLGVLALAVLLMGMSMLMTYMGKSYNITLWIAITAIIGAVGIAWTYKTWERLDKERDREIILDAMAAARRIERGEY